MGTPTRMPTCALAPPRTRPISSSCFTRSTSRGIIMLMIQQTRNCLMPRNAKFPSQNKQNCKPTKTKVQFPVSSQPCSAHQAAPDPTWLLCGSLTGWLGHAGPLLRVGDSAHLVEPGLQPEVPAVWTCCGLCSGPHGAVPGGGPCDTLCLLPLPWPGASYIEDLKQSLLIKTRLI